jgi:hypothetical protein
MPIPHYPSIVLLEKRPEIFAVKEVVCCEKLHGSCFRVHFPLGMTNLSDVRYGSRDVEDHEPAFPLGTAKKWFEARPDLLGAMWEVIKSYGFSDVTVFGEAYGPGIKAQGVKYTDGTEMLFRAFDIMVGLNFVTWDLFCEITEKMRLPRVHEVWRGEPSQAALDALLGKPSVEGRLNGIEDPGNHAEGIVVRTNPLFRNVFGEWLIAKYKYGKFAEKTTALGTVSTVKLPREATPADAFAATYVTQGRVMNAVGRLADQGKPLKGAMTDMPALLTEILADLLKECATEWKETGMPDGTLKGAVSKVLGPLYREMISEEGLPPKVVTI